jgi:uncharacterized RDD family membrane protein YckC
MKNNIDVIIKQEYDTATFIRRALAYLVDLLFVATIAYFAVVIFKVFAELDTFFELFEASQEQIENVELYNQMRGLFWKLVFNLSLIWLGAKLLYFTLMPAIIGNGRTIGKLFAGIGVVFEETLEEISPSRLMLREFVGRTLVESVLFIPYLVSIIIAFFKTDSKSVHDLIAKTVVIRFGMHEADLR